MKEHAKNVSKTQKTMRLNSVNSKKNKKNEFVNNLRNWLKTCGFKTKID